MLTERNFKKDQQLFLFKLFRLRKLVNSQKLILIEEYIEYFHDGEACEMFIPLNIGKFFRVSITVLTNDSGPYLVIRWNQVNAIDPVGISTIQKKKAVFSPKKKKYNEFFVLIDSIDTWVLELHRTDCTRTDFNIRNLTIYSLSSFESADTFVSSISEC